MLMHIWSSEEITLLEFNEEEEGDQQETRQAADPREEEQIPSVPIKDRTVVSPSDKIERMPIT